MSVLPRLASSLGRRDEVPNQQLAAELVAAGDTAGIAELAGALATARMPIQNDAIKALYEIGALNPRLIAPHAEAFFLALESRNNRMVWGAMTALSELAPIEPNLLAARLPEIIDAANRGSVIAKDRCVLILATLAAIPGASPVAWEQLLAVLRTSAVNQTAMYAEAAARAAPVNDAQALAEVVRTRLAEIAHPPKRARLEKVLRALARL
jgi:hypothetical protein